MLTKEAFNALLKTLEEPPEHVKFMFATTEPEQVLATILSRCQRFDLRRIPAALIVEHLTGIAKTEQVQIDETARNYIARGAEGGVGGAEASPHSSRMAQPYWPIHNVSIRPFVVHVWVGGCGSSLAAYLTYGTTLLLNPHTVAGAQA